MKKLVFIPLLLCSAGLSAQVDSFMVEGKTFRFEIPMDGVLEEKVNGVQSDSTWNLVLPASPDPNPGPPAPQKKRSTAE